MSVTTEELLQNRRGVNANDLNKTLNLNSFEIQYPNAKTKYFNLTDMQDFLNRNKNILTLLSINIECINSKYDELKILVETLAENDVFFNIICIQEAWLSENICLDQFKLQNYNMVSQCYNNACTKKGGLITYVRNNLNIKKQQNYNTFQTWEGLFIDIEDNNKNCVKIGNIYRPPKYNNNHASIDSFLSEFCPIIDITAHQTNNYILAGDFNIDLLKVNNNAKYQEFYDYITGHNLLPNITLPTRLSKRNATLIDNIFSKNVKTSTPVETGILVHKISDHMASISAINFDSGSFCGHKQLQIRTYP